MADSISSNDSCVAQYSWAVHSTDIIYVGFSGSCTWQMKACYMSKNTMLNMRMEVVMNISVWKTNKNFWNFPKGNFNNTSSGVTTSPAFVNGVKADSSFPMKEDMECIWYSYAAAFEVSSAW